MDAGLDSPYAEQLLRASDPDGRLGLRTAPDELLDQARQRTRGFPRALEALAAILAADRDATLPDLLAQTAGPPGIVVEVLVGEAFSRLDGLAQQVMQALAIYPAPVPPVAIDYLLVPYQPAIDAAPVLARLANMQFVRREAGRYYLHSVDRDYALGRIPAGEPADLDTDPPLFTRWALRVRGADYFAQTRTEQEEWKSLDDLAPQLAEFELRCQGGEYDTAAEILLYIDDTLSSWGYHQLIRELHERLQGRLDDPGLRQASLDSLRRARQALQRLDDQQIDQAGARLLHTLRGHENSITRLAWLPDGQSLLSASLDGSIRLWDCQAGHERRAFLGHSDRVFDLAVTSNGRQFVSASADKTLRVWDLGTGEHVHTLTGHEDYVSAVAASPDGKTLISGSWDRTLRVWDLQSGQELYALRGHTERINAVTLTLDGHTAISASTDQTLKVWDLLTRTEKDTLTGRAGSENDVIVLANDQVVVSAGDATIREWRLEDGRQLRVLHGPTAPVTGLSVSSDGRVLAVKSSDSNVRFWRTDTWEPVGAIDEPSPEKPLFASIAFAPHSSTLATLGEKDTIIRIWEFDIEGVLHRTVPGEVVQYTTAKLALVGDQGVGKTGLGLRLVKGKFEVTQSTHGQQFWVVDRLNEVRPNGTECDVILWDFAGQPDYRLVHALFLDDVDLALVVFDPTRYEPLEPVEYWLKQLRGPEHTAVPAILVAARIDVGYPRLSPEELTAWAEQAGVSGGYIATSAYTGEGVDELTATIKAQVSWAEKSPTVSPAVFTQIKRAVFSLRESLAADGRNAELSRLLSPEQLSRQLTASGVSEEVQFTFDEMMTAVGHLAKHGYVTLLETSFGQAGHPARSRYH